MQNEENFVFVDSSVGFVYSYKEEIDYSKITTLEDVLNLQESYPDLLIRIYPPLRSTYLNSDGKIILNLKVGDKVKANYDSKNTIRTIERLYIKSLGDYSIIGAKYDDDDFDLAEHLEKVFENEIVDNVVLDNTNQEFNYAIDFINHTNKFVYLTGKAGTGKTTFLKYLRETTKKKIVVLAPTGVAAINAGGQTINSFFQIPFGPFVNNDKRLRIRKDLGDNDETTIYNTFKYSEDKRVAIEKLELLIIDEVSMVRCDTLDVIDKILRVFRKKLYLPFGGVQVVLIGDTFQLPPIADFEQWEILKNYYQSPFFFSSMVVTENKPIYIELKKIYRQKEQEFIDLLNKIRINQITDMELSKLNKKYDPTYSHNNSNNHIILSTTNAQVTQTNSTKLNEIKSDLKIFKGEIEGIFPKDIKGNYILPTEQSLHLKVGAQVMILKNGLGYYNGKIGTVSSLEDDKIIIEFSKVSKIQIEKSSWNNVVYAWNKVEKKIEEKRIGTFTQYPLRLAWAITVHKSQGLTFENVYADLGSAFENGQVYVALSRCTSYNGLVLKSQIHRSKIKTDPRVIEFAKTETPSTLIVQELNSGKADYYYKKVRKDLKGKDFERAYDNFITAIKFRNDIETDLFKRYFITISNRITKNISNYIEVSDTLNDFKNIEKEIEKLKILVENLSKDKIYLQKKVDEQNNAVRILLDETKEIESNNKKLKSVNFHLEKNNIEFSNTIKNNADLLKESKSIILEMQTKNTLFEKEIKRLENLKWYHKLLRK